MRGGGGGTGRAKKEKKLFFIIIKKSSDGNKLDRVGGDKALMAWPLAEDFFCGFPKQSEMFWLEV